MPNLARLPVTGSDANTWSDILNRQITQTTSSANGAFNSFNTFTSRPTNLTPDDEGKTYLFTQTGNWHEWNGSDWKVHNKSEINVKDYGAIGDGVADDTAAIQRVMDNIVGVGSIFLPVGKFRITQSLILRRPRSLFGNGDAEIIADFGSWKNTDYVALKLLVDDAVTQVGVLEGLKSQVSGFKIAGINNSSIKSTAIKAYSIYRDVASAVNISFIGIVYNIYITRFDTAINLRECWNSTFSNLIITDCRLGILIDGKSVNIGFSNINLTNFTKSYTSSTLDSFGIYIDSGFDYTIGSNNSVEGRPEGIYINQCLVFGADNNIKIIRALQVTVSDSIIDGALKDCISIVGPNGVFISKNYIFTGGNNYNGIQFEPINSSTNNNISITDNNFTGTSTAGFGISAPLGGLSRKGISISSNKFSDWKSAISLGMGFNYSTISNNYGEGISTSFISLQNGGYNSLIDGNSCINDVNILFLNTVTSDTLIIGANKSNTTRTTHKAKATLLAGQLSVNLPNLMYFSENYTRVITTISPSGSIGNWYIQNNISQSAAKLNVSIGPTVNTTIYYECTSIPYSAF